MAQLENGQCIKSVNGANIKVIKLLGEGGQGYVYQVEYNGKQKALKWYKPEEIHEDSLNWFNKNIRKNIENGSPSPAFLWPEDITEWYDNTFGYIMPLRPSDYKEFPDYLLAKSEFSKFSSMIDAAINIVTGFRILHREGYTYQDLNDGNFFMRPSDGSVLICDNDNVAEYGENSGIAGKARYMAPLVVLNKKMPDKITDRFSLAVVLFMLFIRNHPLEGKAVQGKVILTEGYQRKYFGENPVFIADPSDDSNRPVKGEAHNRNFEIRWPLMSEEIRQLFVKAFSKDAMKEQNGAAPPIEITWCRALLQYKSNLICCPNCKKQIVFEQNRPLCMKCGKNISIPAYLNVTHYKIPAVAGNNVYMEHIKDFESESYNPEIIGEIIVAKNDSSAIGLRNLSDMVWQYEKDGTFVQVKKNDVVRLVKGRKIKINNKHIVVE